MGETRAFLASIGLPPGDLHEHPDSQQRFPDGAEYRIEIPSVEGPACLEAVLEDAARLDVPRRPQTIARTILILQTGRMPAPEGEVVPYACSTWSCEAVRSRSIR